MRLLIRDSVSHVPMGLPQNNALGAFDMLQKFIYFDLSKFYYSICYFIGENRMAHCLLVQKFYKIAGNLQYERTLTSKPTYRRNSSVVGALEYLT